MREVSYTHTIDAPLERVIDAYRSAEFYAAKQKHSGAYTVEILEEEELPGGKRRMVARVEEPTRVPPFLRRSDVDVFEDESLLDPERGELTWKITPGTAADVFFVSGRVGFEAAGEQTRVTFTTRIEVKIPLLGKKAEKIGVEKIEAETAQQAEFIRKWLSEG